MFKTLDNNNDSKKITTTTYIFIMYTKKRIKKSRINSFVNKIQI